ncbi:exonuclease mut-7 homolog [Halichoeres trimaculatus]|uniref:exonuclease mut-7 homolog n=1 Tax=Halichoeres trimaculatus TaxID=147232 RepID=UPI003D9F6BAE
MNQTPTETVGLDPTKLRDQLLELWTLRDMQALHAAAFLGFSKLSEPLEALLTILEGCPGKQKGRSHTLGHNILMEFQIWIKEHPQVTLSSFSEQQQRSLQQRALSLLTDDHTRFVDGLINIYQLNSLDPDTLRLHIIILQSLNCYKEAAALGIKLKIQEELNMEEICIPLILQNKLSLAENFVAGHNHLEQRLVTLLDSWCHPLFSVEHVMKNFPRLTLSKQSVDHIHPKLLTKQVFRLVEKFNIDPGLYPHALQKRRKDSLRFLMYKRFVDKSMTEENWCDHVQYVVADDTELQIMLVEMLLKYCSPEKASQWSSRYNIPRHRLPSGLWETQQSPPPELQEMYQTDSAQAEEWVPSQDHLEKFYQVPLSKDHVYFVDTQEALQRCQNIVLKEGSVVGVDMEWQPTFGCMSAQKVALIQLAVQDQVFLLDLCATGFCQHPDTVSFIRSLFSEKHVLKLGYGMSGDVRCLLATWEQFLNEPLKINGGLDLLHVHKKIQRSNVKLAQDGPKEVLVGEKGSAEKGLSQLVQQVLGKPLDKTEQMSNWKKRPLRISQIRYAVADVCCLLDVYSVLSKDPASFGLPADLHSIVSCPPEKSQEKKQKEEQAKQNEGECQGAQRVGSPCSAAEKGPLCGEKPREDAPPLHPQELRVVCDNMLQGLGRYLRCLGVDVVMLENSDDHRKAAKLAQAEGRVILTCGQPFHSLRSQVGEGRCLALDCSEKAKDQAVQVLRHFNVQPTPSDIFSRCQACNSDEYVAVPRREMVQMLKEKGFLQDQDDTHFTLQQEEEKLGDMKAPELPRYAPQCQWASLSDLDPDTLTFPGGAPIQLHTVPPGLLPRVPLFYICTRCGKVFWEGSHFSRVLSMFEDIFHITDAEDTESPVLPVNAAQQN